MAMTLQQIVDELNARHLTGDAARLLAYGQQVSDQIAGVEEALANAEEEVTLVRGKLNDAEKLFDAAQARLGEEALTEAEVLAILGVTPVPAPTPSYGEPTPLLAAHLNAVAADLTPLPSPAAIAAALPADIPDSIGAIGVVAPTPAPDVHPFVAQITAAQQAAKAEEKPVTASEVLEAAAQGPAVAQVVADLADRIAAQQQASVASIDNLSATAPGADLPSTPPSAPVGESK